jgi:AcrR family transcriptional regulator
VAPEAVTAPAHRGRPRSEQADRAIVEAALDVVADGGVDAFCVEAVASRAGVGKTTIYRRFPNRATLLTEALATLNDDLPAPPDTGAVRSDLVALLDGWRERHDCTHTGRVMARMMGAARSHPDLFARYFDQVVEPRRERFRTVLRRGVSRGEVRDDLDLELLVSAIIGPMLLALMSQPAGRGARTDSEALVDLVLQGAEPRP